MTYILNYLLNYLVPCYIKFVDLNAKLLTEDTTKTAINLLNEGCAAVDTEWNNEVIIEDSDLLTDVLIKLFTDFPISMLY